jgi:hypothetical protein
MRLLSWTSAVVVTLAFVVAGRAQEEKVALDKLPKAVIDAVKKRFPAAGMKSASKETEDGKTMFEVAINDRGHNIDVTLTPEGTLTGFERTIDAKELPAKVAATLKEKYPGAKYEVCEEVHHVKNGKESMDYYEVLLTAADKKKWEVTVKPDGKPFKPAEEKKDKD